MTAILVFDAGGQAVGWAMNADRPMGVALPPGGSSLEFDPAANAPLVSSLQAGVSPYTLVGGQLRRSGQPVAIAADSQAGARRKQLRAALATLDQPLPGNATLADVRQRVNLISRGVAMLLEREFGAGS